MSGVSSAELLLLLVIGLIVLGPKRLPEIAQKVGGWVGQARRMTRVMKRQLDEELRAAELHSINKPQIAAVKSPVAPAISNNAASTSTPDPADPAYDDDVVTDHIPRDDDGYSPQHEKDQG
ncbi:MAG: Sec-independent protein translocase protein TatB [Gammaproteobacteria bacterium]|nr:Sec-independent protein translocase protein TatB [Gammaproteobacteria bacterium]MDH5304812.1 Sec-independent protein translocase protein TatB [Gammaproteobacteria bacterium]MDH5322679.1 Sec-independent protein translocase protein TatB [Gammaproteobacteria bacterium]